MTAVSLPINVGFVGLSSAGWAATTLGPSLLHPSLQKKYKLIAVSTTSEDSANASAKKHSSQLGHVVQAYSGDTAQIAANPDVDLVVVSVRPWHQKNAILPIIEAKKNFFLEWPVGRDLKETLEIAEAAHKHDVRSIVGLQTRRSPVVRKVKELVESGTIGIVRSTTLIGIFPREGRFWPPEISADNVFTLDKSNGASPLRVVAGPQLDPLIHTLGDFRTINATAATIYPTATILGADGQPTGETGSAVVPDHYTISGQLASGALATIVWRTAFSRTRGRTQFRWEIDGEEGSIRVEADNSSHMNIHSKRTLFLNGERVEVQGVEEGVVGTLVSVWDAYVAGQEGEYATIDDAVKTHRILDAVERSLLEGQAIVL
ncbi:hypothetical protein HYPSUDRAFT_219276 [Hypholoma sublateritium FD-334 SS-4]|uniref:Uncharacterized protein n=1 Tax=Hypholoma sublateritium (strain FD-334 SS-4) TaxID=945553 RepID=A0A0D2P8W1_HYPSF|nr:hypothetical protein HYPSUDRAFT_219276 [Hypholoma sublateritium FD-334 SS-4]